MTIPKDPARKDEYLRLLSESHKGQHSSPATEFKKGHIPHNKGKTLEELYGKERAEEIRSKLQESHKGQKPWHTGKHWPEWVKEKFSKAKKGKPSRKGRKFSLEWRMHLSEAAKKRAKIYPSNLPKNQKPWNKGRLLKDDISKETLERLYIDERWGIDTIARMFGVSTATILKYLKVYRIPMRTISESLKGKPKSTEHVRNVLKANAVKPNKSELRLLGILRGLDSNWRYVGDGSLVIDGRCPDFWDGGNRLVELFGGFWHRDDDPQERVDFFARRGYDCVVVWDSELKDVEGVIRKIKTLYPEEVQIEKVQVKQGT